MSTVKIYALRDPADGRVRYVGKATDPARRFSAHMQTARNGADHYAARWIRKVLETGAKPVLCVLHVVAPGEDWQEVERDFIRLAREVFACNLTNTLAGGEGLTSEDARAMRARPETKARHAAAMASPEYRARHAAAMARPDVKARMSAALADPEVKARHAAAVTARYENPAERARLGDAIRAGQSSPEFRAQRSAIKSAECTAKREALRVVELAQATAQGDAALAALAKKWGKQDRGRARARALRAQHTNVEPSSIASSARGDDRRVPN